jgi:predicted metalloprotease
MKRRLRFVALVPVLIAALAAGCSFADSASPAPTATATVVPSPTPAPVSLEGRFGYNEMREFLETVKPMVQAFFERQYPDAPAPRQIAFVPRGTVITSPCAPGGRRGSHDSEAYEYCPANASVYIGQDLLWAFFRVGDAAPVVALAHEWGHHIQTVRNVSVPRSAAQSVAFENQADCLSGAWAAYAGERGWLERDDDLQDISGLLQAIGSRETRSRDHGTVAERSAAFRLGFDEGVKGCNTFVPSTPVA